MLICLVGKSGSGKSTVANLLCMHSNDILHVDIDTISHQIVNQKEVSAKLVDTFGNSILKDNQSLLHQKKVMHVLSPEISLR